MYFVRMATYLLLLAALSGILVLSGCKYGESREPSPMEETVSALSTQNAVLSTQLASQATFLSYLATRDFAPRIPATTRQPTPYLPVSGSVEIEQGRCCLGAVAGSDLEIQVSFQATSPYGAVTRMRVGVGGRALGEDEMDELEWQAYNLTGVYVDRVVLNWTGWYVSVQYMDEIGNLSPVYHDDIAIEGQP